MSDATYQTGDWARHERDSVALPTPVVMTAPVLIGDCVTPLGGETLLSLLWKRLERDE